MLSPFYNIATMFSGSFQRLLFTIVFTVCAVAAQAKASNKYTVLSPDGKVEVIVTVGEHLAWSVDFDSNPVVLPSALKMHLLGGDVLGYNANPVSAKEESVNQKIVSPFYKKASLDDHYQQLTLSFKKNYGVIFRVYNEGAAYRFFTNRKDSLTVVSEASVFSFAEDNEAFASYVVGSRNDLYEHSYECTYKHVRLSGLAADSVVYFPMMVALKNGSKAIITEADLEDYPAMYLKKDANNPVKLNAVFPAYPLGENRGGYNMTQSRVTSRGDLIGRTAGRRTFPWRMITFSRKDKELLNNDMVYKLATPSSIKDLSWIKPGKVAWDWWNDWNIYNVDFKAGINTLTYKYYIDFAAAHQLEYIMLDEGWAKKEDIMQIIPEVDLQEIIDYGKQKNVGVWLWAGMYPINARMDEAFTHYSKMGIKGFKIDFINRDDQPMMQFYYRAARKAAENHLMLDFHGACKPTGLMRTYPNVLNYEGVYGLEMVKVPNKVDFPAHAASIPFIRMLAGAMDYTPGAMRNAVKKEFTTSYTNPMSQGTRCQQMAMYVLFEAPLNMLSDNPSNYIREPECTEFICSVPTTFDETAALDGEVGAYAAIARRKGETWYAGALTNWDARDIEIDLSFLGEGKYQAVIFKDGVNADRAANDYVKETKVTNASQKLQIHLAPGGGWAAKFTRL